MFFQLPFRFLVICLWIHSDIRVYGQIKELYNVNYTFIPQRRSGYIPWLVTCDFLFHATLQTKLSHKVFETFGGIIIEDFENESHYMLSLVRGLCEIEPQFFYDLDVFLVYLMFRDRLNKYATLAIKKDYDSISRNYKFMMQFFDERINSIRCDQFISNENNDFNINSFTELFGYIDNTQIESSSYQDLSGRLTNMLGMVGNQITDRLGEGILSNTSNFFNNILFNNILDSHPNFLHNLSDFFDNTFLYKNLIKSDLMYKYRKAQENQSPIFVKIYFINRFQESFLTFISVVMQRFVEIFMLYFLVKIENSKLRDAYHSKMNTLLTDFNQFFKAYNRSQMENVKVFGDRLKLLKLRRKNLSEGQMTKYIALQEELEESITTDVNKLNSLATNFEDTTHLGHVDGIAVIDHAIQLNKDECLYVEKSNGNTIIDDTIFIAEVFLKYLMKTLDGIDFELVRCLLHHDNEYTP